MCLGRNKAPYTLVLLVVGLFLCGCDQENDFFTSKSSETIRIQGRETCIPSKGWQTRQSMSNTYYNEYDKSNVYPSGTTQFYGEMNGETGITKGTNYYENGKHVDGVVMPGKRLWDIETDNP